MMSELRLILLVLGVLLVLGIYLWGRRQRHLWQSPPPAEEEDWLEVLAQKRRQGLIDPADKAMPTLTPHDHADIHSDDDPTSPRFDQLLETAMEDGDLESGPAAEQEPQSKPEGHVVQEKGATTAERDDGMAEIHPAPPRGETLILTLFVMARPGRQMHGLAIHEACQQAGLRFGAMDIYHYHKGNEASGEVLFSMANMVEPGTFSPSQMGEFSSPGLAFFMQLPAHTEASMMFEKMLASARMMAQMLDAELKDESRSDMSQQTIGHLRERVKEYDFKHRRQGAAS